ncbi:methyltransferase family protein [Saccharothrix coeruleofusca]|uniref:Protein-S-isoprenylcysteine O-methyltransferase Ste14 n=1 Tax=Saccharothrix coeruleofusca TaxID=33919 RepID=A0A918ARA6_9PSEU|nr:isoprenylcysteine carboxylmethyltransferase family protein [Saccharothrix coeruleofusca]MBP2335298.1 protein-S-isoprenylcysteine O-methyltransferase Ste14 [Saccharothrix coeruleofusca]GGP72030.1 hypothetical protein GCM10010185_51770 [Saccharothrix coeruleofusca]
MPLLLVVIPLAWGVNELSPSIQWPPLTGHQWLATTAAATLPVCTTFTVWARIALGAMWTPLPSVRSDHVLRTDGPYAITRHPIYTGVLGMLLCTALIIQHGWALAAFGLAAVTLRAKIHREERLLCEVFGQAYESYRARVPRLLPLGGLMGLRPVP